MSLKYIYIAVALSLSTAISGCAKMKLDNIDYDGKEVAVIEDSFYDKLSGDTGFLVDIWAVNDQKINPFTESDIAVPEGEYLFRFKCLQTPITSHSPEALSHTYAKVKGNKCYTPKFTTLGLKTTRQAWITTNSVTGEKRIEYENILNIPSLKNRCAATEIVEIECE